MTNFSHICNAEFYINSTSTLDCTRLDEQAANASLGSNFTCTALHPITTSSSSSSPTNSSTLSTGAKVGIAIGAIIGAVLVGCGAWTLYYQQKSKSVQKTETAQILPTELPAEKGDAELEAKHGQSEALGQGRASGFAEVFEMPGNHEPELT